jgi:hypothetical protein
MSLSTVDFLVIGSSLSLRRVLRSGGGASIYGAADIASCISLRCMSRCGSCLSLAGIVRTGSVYGMSVVDFGQLGSTLSARTLARLG